MYVCLTHFLFSSTLENAFYFCQFFEVSGELFTTSIILDAICFQGSTDWLAGISPRFHVVNR